MQLSTILASAGALAVGVSAAAIERRWDNEDPTDAMFQYRILYLHNWARSHRWNATTNEGTPWVWWDAALAAGAKAYADTCKPGGNGNVLLGRDPNLPVNVIGENTGVEYGATDPAYIIVYDWIYNGGWNVPLPPQNVNPTRLNDYTNLVWKGTQKVGCGYSNCGDGNYALVCRYWPPVGYNSPQNIKNNILPYQELEMEGTVYPPPPV